MDKRLYSLFFLSTVVSTWVGAEESHCQKSSQAQPGQLEQLLQNIGDLNDYLFRVSTLYGNGGAPIPKDVEENYKAKLAERDRLNEDVKAQRKGPEKLLPIIDFRQNNQLTFLPTPGQGSSRTGNRAVQVIGPEPIRTVGLLEGCREMIGGSHPYFREIPFKVFQNGNGHPGLRVEIPIEKFNTNPLAGFFFNTYGDFIQYEPNKENAKSVTITQENYKIITTELVQNLSNIALDASKSLLDVSKKYNLTPEQILFWQLIQNQTSQRPFTDGDGRPSFNPNQIVRALSPNLPPPEAVNGPSLMVGSSVLNELSTFRYQHFQKLSKINAIKSQLELFGIKLNFIESGTIKSLCGDYPTEDKQFLLKLHEHIFTKKEEEHSPTEWLKESAEAPSLLIKPEDISLAQEPSLAESLEIATQANERYFTGEIGKLEWLSLLRLSLGSHAPEIEITENSAISLPQKDIELYKRWSEDRKNAWYFIKKATDARTHQFFISLAFQAKKNYPSIRDLLAADGRIKTIFDDLHAKQINIQDVFVPVRPIEYIELLGQNLREDFNIVEKFGATVKKVGQAYELDFSQMGHEWMGDVSNDQNIHGDGNGVFWSLEDFKEDRVKQAFERVTSKKTVEALLNKDRSVPLFFPDGTVLLPPSLDGKGKFLVYTQKTYSTALDTKLNAFKAACIHYNKETGKTVVRGDLFRLLVSYGITASDKIEQDTEKQNESYKKIQSSFVELVRLGIPPEILKNSIQELQSTTHLGYLHLDMAQKKISEQVDNFKISAPALAILTLTNPGLVGTMLLLGGGKATAGIVLDSIYKEGSLSSHIKTRLAKEAEGLFGDPKGTWIMVALGPFARLQSLYFNSNIAIGAGTGIYHLSKLREDRAKIYKKYKDPKTDQISEEDQKELRRNEQETIETAINAAIDIGFLVHTAAKFGKGILVNQRIKGLSTEESVRLNQATLKLKADPSGKTLGLGELEVLFRVYKTRNNNTILSALFSDGGKSLSEEERTRILKENEAAIEKSLKDISEIKAIIEKAKPLQSFKLWGGPSGVAGLVKGLIGRWTDELNDPNIIRSKNALVRINFLLLMTGVLFPQFGQYLNQNHPDFLRALENVEGKVKLLEARDGVETLLNAEKIPDRIKTLEELAISLTVKLDAFVKGRDPAQYKPDEVRRLWLAHTQVPGERGKFTKEQIAEKRRWLTEEKIKDPMTGKELEGAFSEEEANKSLRNGVCGTGEHIWSPYTEQVWKFPGIETFKHLLQAIVRNPDASVDLLKNFITPNDYRYFKLEVDAKGVKYLIVSYFNTGHKPIKVKFEHLYRMYHQHGPAGPSRRSDSSEKDNSLYSQDEISNVFIKLIFRANRVATAERNENLVIEAHAKTIDGRRIIIGAKFPPGSDSEMNLYHFEMESQEHLQIRLDERDRIEEKLDNTRNPEKIDHLTIRAKVLTVEMVALLLRVNPLSISSERANRLWLAHLASTDDLRTKLETLIDPNRKGPNGEDLGRAFTKEQADTFLRQRVCGRKKAKINDAQIPGAELKTIIRKAMLDIKHKDSSVRAKAIESLLNIEPKMFTEFESEKNTALVKKLMEVLFEKIKDKKEKESGLVSGSESVSNMYFSTVRNMAIEFLVKLSKEISDPQLEVQIIETLLAVIKEDPAEQVQSYALGKLFEMKYDPIKLKKVIIENLSSPSEFLRRVALRLFVDIETNQIERKRIFESKLKDSDSVIRDEAKKYLNQPNLDAISSWHIGFAGRDKVKSPDVIAAVKFLIGLSRQYSAKEFISLIRRNGATDYTTDVEISDGEQRWMLDAQCLKRLGQEGLDPDFKIQFLVPVPK